MSILAELGHYVSRNDELQKNSIVLFVKHDSLTICKPNEISKLASSYGNRSVILMCDRKLTEADRENKNSIFQKKIKSKMERDRSGLSFVCPQEHLISQYWEI